MKTAPRKFLDFKELRGKGSTASNRCLQCRGTKMLCGKDRCPIIIKFYSSMKTKALINGISLYGSTPPSVFVGRYGYPNVSIGPMVPPQQGDTSLIDTPELWIGKSIEDIGRNKP